MIAHSPGPISRSGDPSTALTRGRRGSRLRHDRKVRLDRPLSLPTAVRGRLSRGVPADERDIEAQDATG